MISGDPPGESKEQQHLELETGGVAFKTGCVAL